MLVPLAVLMATDGFLTIAVYHYSFRWQSYVTTWIWYVAAMALGSILLRKQTTFARGAAGALLGPTGFFLVSNYGVWASGFNGYPRTLAGLGACYLAGVPFYRNDLVSTAIVLGVALVGAVLGLVSLALVGWAGIRHYIALLSALSTSTAFPALVPAMPNVRGFINVLFAGRLGPHYLTLLETAGLFVLLSWPILEWRRRGWEPDGKTFDLLFSLSIVVCVMTSHHLLINGLLLLIVPALLLLDYAAAAYPSGLRRWRLAVPLLLLFPMTIFLNLEVENRLGFLLPVILWLAFAISKEIPKAQKQTGGGERGRS